MWWLISIAPDFRGQRSGFESGISHNDPDALKDHCVIGNVKLREGRETYPCGKRIFKKDKKNKFLQ